MPATLHAPSVLRPSLCAFAIAALALLAPVASIAQQDARSVRASNQFPNLIGPYLPRQVPEPNFANTSRIDLLLKNGKLMLSLSDAVALALENNLDVAIARYNLSIADTDILRAKSGATIRGVATGLVQGTPGGGIGGFGSNVGSGAGGTSGGAGGAGTGASGLVESTLGVGAPLQSYDPQLTAKLNLNHVALPLSNTVTTAGISTLRQNYGIANFAYQQAFATGTSLSVGFDNSRTTDNNPADFLMPAINSGFRVTLQQHLLSGFGLGPNMRFIHIAQNNREISDVAFRDQVIATVSQIQNMYWDLVTAYEDARVQERSLALAQKTLSDNREQLRIGSMAPIEVTQAENEVATRNQDLILAQTNLELQELLMKNAISRNLSDPMLAAAEVVPTDTMYVPEKEPVIPVQDLLSDALAHRPELAEARIDMTNRKISRKSARNAMLPTLDLVGWYGASALAGEQNPLGTCAAGDSPQITGCLPPGSIRRTGIANAFSTLFGYNYPDYAVGFNLTIPIRNRTAQADQIRSELEYRQAELRLQQLENQIGIEVRNAQFTLQQNRARVEAATKARDLAQHTFEIEQQKYRLGASTSFLVLKAQRDLALAESNRVTAMSAYEKSRVELDRATGLTLTHNGIDLQEAERGRVERSPQLPGVVPRKDISQVLRPAPAGSSPQ